MPQKILQRKHFFISKQNFTDHKNRQRSKHMGHIQEQRPTKQHKHFIGTRTETLLEIWHVQADVY